MADISDSSWSETDGNNTQAPPLGWPAGMAPNQVEPTERAAMGAIKRFWDRINGTITTTGAAGIYNWTPANVAFPVVLSQGEGYTFKAHQNGIGGDVFNPNGLGQKPFYKPGGLGPRLLEVNDIQTNSMYTAFYDSALGGTGAFQILGGALPSSVRGVVSGNGAAPGIVGEYLSTLVPLLSEVAINSATTVATLVLPAGDFDVSGELWVDILTGSAVLNGFIRAGVTQTAATLPTGPGDGTALASYDSGPLVSNNRAVVLPVGPVQQNNAISTTIYLVGIAQVSSGNAFGYGKLMARRRR